MNTAPLQQLQQSQTPSEAQPHLCSKSLREKTGVVEEIKAIHDNQVKKIKINLVLSFKERHILYTTSYGM